MFTIRLAASIVACLILAATACSSAFDAPDTPGDVATPAPPSPAATQQAAPAPTSPPVSAATAAATGVPSTATSTASPTSAPAPISPPATATSIPAPPPPAASDAEPPETVERDLEIVTLLPYDAIPAILQPEFITADEADEKMDPGSLVIGLSIDGDNRAYSIPTLSSYEIVNDTVGGKPVAVTW